jgi:4-amino-4-deoxy-L-arabinose transferase-like glycosyltransferase
MTWDRHPPLLVAWALIAVVAVSWGLGSYPLMDQDEGRNGEVAREMAASNDYVLPHLNGLPYIDKPVLSFAATAAAMELLGPTELAARSVPFLCTLATALLVGWCGGRWFGREAGWVAGIAAGTAPLPLAFSRIVILDSLLALLVTCAVLAFHAAVEARLAGRSARPWTVAAWAAIGLGILTKGPVALAVPLLAAAPYAAWRRASWAVWNPLGPLVMAAIVGPWVWFMEARLPGYLQYVAVTETWQRVASDEFRRTQPWWYFGAVAAAGFFPWWPFALGRRRLAGGPPDPRRILLWLWLLVPLVMFSASRSKLPQYILPLMPAVALLVASRWASREHAPTRAVAVAVAGWGLLAAGFGAAAAGRFADHGLPPRLADAAPGPAAAMVAVCLVAVACALVALRANRGPALVAALSAPLLAVPVVLQPVISALAEHRSERALATTVASRFPESTAVVGLETWRPSLSFYLARPIPILSADGNELRSNFILRTAERWRDPQGILRPLPASPAELGRCVEPTVVLVYGSRRDLQEQLETAGLELVATGSRLVAYACNPQQDHEGALARDAGPPPRVGETADGAIPKP